MNNNRINVDKSALWCTKKSIANTLLNAYKMGKTLIKIGFLVEHRTNLALTHIKTCIHKRKKKKHLKEFKLKSSFTLCSYLTCA